MLKKQNFRLLAALLAAAFALILGAIPSFAMTMGDYVRNLGEDKVIEQANQDTGGHFVPENVAGKRLRMFEVTPGQVQGPLFEWTQTLGSGLFTLTWGDPHGDAKNGRQRYIGYNYWDEDVTNPAFPHDDWPGGYLDDPNDPNWRWIEEPWWKFRLRHDFDSDNPAIGSAYLKAMQLGLLCYYWDVILDKEVFMGNIKANPAFWNNLHRYVHVLVPPTTYNWGMGRMWHQRADGSIWYISVPIVPTGLQLECDLTARMEPEEVTALPGQDVEFTVRVKYKDPPQFVGPLGNLGAQELMPTYSEVEHVFGGQTEYPVLEPAGDSPPADEAGFLPLATNGKEYAYKIRVKAKGTSSDVMAAFVPVLASDRNPADNAVLGRIKVIAPDFYARIDPHQVQAEPGQGLTFKATFGLKPTFPQAARALVRAFHVVNGVEYPVQIVLNGVPVAPDQPVEFQPGEEKQGTVAVTAQESDSRVVVKINPVGTSEDADWSDNRDEAVISVTPPCTDISVSIGASEAVVMSGDTVTVYVTVRRANDGPDREVPVSVSLVSSRGGSKTWSISLPRGGAKSLSATFTLSAGSPVDVTFTAEAWPQGVEDCAPGNNRASTVVGVDVPPDLPPVEDKGIIIRLIS